MIAPQPPIRDVPAALPHVVAVLIPPYPSLTSETRARVLRDVTNYVRDQINAMPSFLRYPYKLALIVFQWLPMFFWLRPFSALPPLRQDAYLSCWRDAPLGSMRDFVKLIQSCALLAYFDHPLVRQELEAARHHQLRERAVR